ncbi:MAG: LEPR-XLL domain-containing protein [Planctomycetaceae bacterium]
MFADVEQLESRILLSATAKLRNGTLTIRGDSSDDAILVNGQGFGVGEVEVFHDSDGDGTVDVSLGEFSGVTNIKIVSRGGNDAIGVADLNITGNLTINTGGGDDCVFLQGGLQGSPAEVGGTVNIKTGGGNDYLRIESYNIAGNLTVATGAGDEIVHLQDVVTTEKMGVNLGGGNDYLISNFTVDFGVGSTVLGGGGTDQILTNGGVEAISSQFELFPDEYPPELLTLAIAIEEECYYRLGGT